MFLIIAIGLAIGVYGLIVSLYGKHLELQQKINTSTANIIVEPEVHTNFEVIPSVYRYGDSYSDYGMTWIYGVKNKIIYYKKSSQAYEIDNIIRTKDTTYDMTKTGYSLCSFRPTLTGWVLLYGNPVENKVLFSIRDNTFAELTTYGPWNCSVEYDSLIYSYQHPYVWLDTYLYNTIKMNITTGVYSPSEVPDFDCNYKFTGNIFEVDNRKIFVEDFVFANKEKGIYNYLFFYDGTYFYYVPDIFYYFELHNVVATTFTPFKAVKISG